MKGSTANSWCVLATPLYRQGEGDVSCSYIYTPNKQQQQQQGVWCDGGRYENLSCMGWENSRKQKPIILLTYAPSPPSLSLLPFPLSRWSGRFGAFCLSSRLPSCVFNSAISYTPLPSTSYLLLLP